MLSVKHTSPCDVLCLKHDARKLKILEFIILSMMKFAFGMQIFRILEQEMEKYFPKKILLSQILFEISASYQRDRKIIEQTRLSYIVQGFSF